MFARFNCGDGHLPDLSVGLGISREHGSHNGLFYPLVCLSHRRGELQIAAGLAFGMAVNIKVFPLIFVPSVFFYLKNWRVRITFFFFAALIVLLFSMPYLVQDPIAIIKGTLGYKGTPAPWGLSNILYFFGLYTNETARGSLRLIIATGAVVVPFWMNRQGVNSHNQLGAITFLFLFLTPGFGVQYLAWAVPFILTLGLGWTLSYYCSGGVFLFLLYDYWSASHWYFAESHIQPAWNPTTSVMAYACWGLIGLALIRYRDKVRDLQRLPSSEALTVL